MAKKETKSVKKVPRKKKVAVKKPAAKKKAAAKKTRAKPEKLSAKPKSIPMIEALVPGSVRPVPANGGVKTRGGAPPTAGEVEKSFVWEDKESLDDDDLGDDEEFDFVRLSDFPDAYGAVDLSRLKPSQEVEDDDPLSALPPEMRRAVEEAAGRPKGTAGGVKTRGHVGPTEDRQRVQTPTNYPFSAVCSLEMRRGNKVSVGPGWLVGRNLVLTAGHNLVHNPVVGQPTQVGIYPGRNGRNGKWPGVHEIAVPSQFLISEPWRASQDKTLDWAMIALNNPLSQRAGSFALRPWEKSKLLKMTGFLVSGYPASKTFGRKIEPYTQWYDVGRLAQVGDRTLLYQMDTTEGQSGAPLIAWDDDRSANRTAKDNYVCVGIHNWFVGNLNQATRVTPALIKQVKRFVIT